MSYKVSVLIPSYNSELTLTRAVRSVFDGNSGLLIQPVIVDDASTDSGLQTVSDMYESRIFNINVYRNEKNLRIAGTLNEAGKHATGRYFIRLDTDDWYQAGCLSIMAKYLDDNPEITFVYGSRKYYGRRSDTYTPRPFNPDDFYQHNAAGYCYMFRREVWDAGLRWRPLGTFGGRVIDLEDWQHLLAMIEMGHKGMAIDTLVLHYCFRWDGTWQEFRTCNRKR
jgi:glycosyltransferase involved in cell wall biosynthesis